jgi:pimeloyl-ACP methyl ester carboxylesterase
MKKFLLLVISIIVILPVSLIRTDISVSDLETKFFNNGSKYINVNGLKIHYRDEGKGFPLVLIHGVGASLHTWDIWTKNLKSEISVIRFDFPPFGLTGSRKDKKYSMQDYVLLVDLLLLKLNVKKCYMAGNSLGAMISLSYANTFPDRVTKLIPIDGGNKRPKKTSGVLKLTSIPFISSILQKMTPRFAVKLILQQVYGDDSKLTEKTVDRYYLLLRREGSRQGILDRSSSMQKELSFDVNKIKAKTLILWGEKDSWIPLKYGQILHRAIKNSKLIIYKNAGHVPMEEIPNKTLKDVRVFLFN